MHGINPAIDDRAAIQYPADDRPKAGAILAHIITSSTLPN